MRIKPSLVALVAFSGALIVVGCTQEARSDYDAAGDKIGEAAQRTGEAVATDAEKTGEVVKKGAATAAEAIDDATKDAQVVAKAGEMTIKVKNAIIAADDVDAKNINVDTVERTIKLKGSVPTVQQKVRVEQIAKDQADEGFAVVNELVVKTQN